MTSDHKNDDNKTDPYPMYPNYELHGMKIVPFCTRTKTIPSAGIRKVYVP